MMWLKKHPSESEAEQAPAQQNSSAKNLKNWIEYRYPLFSTLTQQYQKFPMPRNLNVWWTFGAVLSVILILMLITGIFLSLGYIPTVEQAFSSVEVIDRQMPSGWLIRSMHMAGSNLFLAFLYLHLFRGLYYGSYKAPRELLWFSGLILLLMIMVTAFAGYVLPWGQMSYWAANVGGQAIAAIPWVGEGLTRWIMGGDAPNAITLHRYFVLHFVMAFTIIGVVFAHILFLHHVKSGNPTGVEPKKEETIHFHPYYTAKDGFVLAIVAVIMILLVFFFQDWLTSPENYMPANPLETPENIAPEWYFLPFYGMLQVIPFKFGGLLFAAGSLLLLFLVPWLDRSPIRSSCYRPLYRISLFLLVLAFVTLGFVGKYHSQIILIWAGRFALFYYYLHFLVILPFSNRFELHRSVPQALTNVAEKD